MNDRKESELQLIETEEKKESREEQLKRMMALFNLFKRVEAKIDLIHAKIKAR